MPLFQVLIGNQIPTALGVVDKCGVHSTHNLLWALGHIYNLSSIGVSMDEPSSSSSAMEDSSSQKFSAFGDMDGNMHWFFVIPTTTVTPAKQYSLAVAYTPLLLSEPYGIPSDSTVLPDTSASKKRKRGSEMDRPIETVVSSLETTIEVEIGAGKNPLNAETPQRLCTGHLSIYDTFVSAAFLFVLRMSKLTCADEFLEYLLGDIFTRKQGCIGNFFQCVFLQEHICTLDQDLFVASNALTCPTKYIGASLSNDSSHIDKTTFLTYVQIIIPKESTIIE